MGEQKIKNRLGKKRFSVIYTEFGSISIFEILERELIEGRQSKLESFHSICSILWHNFPDDCKSEGCQQEDCDPDDCMKSARLLPTAQQ